MQDSDSNIAVEPGAMILISTQTATGSASLQIASPPIIEA